MSMLRDEVCDFLRDVVRIFVEKIFQIKGCKVGVSMRRKRKYWTRGSRSIKSIITGTNEATSCRL